MITETQIWDVLESSFTSQHMAQAALDPHMYKRMCNKVLETIVAPEDYVQTVVTDIVLTYNPCAALVETAILLHSLNQ